ncbi:MULTISPECIES: sigma-70 family RNA polymerase sigma factor [unclassified Dehalobacter]|uniref:RNA polymerase sigma factor n=1 Tax=unclassified Dehalobacter TaxID=2635733 RepID=UPI000E6BB28A|nr:MULTISPECIES: sigma-70 family RNA polymerase sigma factor [unclassified Dehalobacter]RJE48909.1 RNA polymerase subunit sigma [Dehalobacter sp. MCB1]TCX52073.1 RNA polymerase subunit sigma [Dehalobacter sp. 14DCB1]TCX53146.1 RNA polymerase subunit sigma [Dehalobacter sp. 12DCB1]
MGDRIEEIYKEHARSVYKFLLSLSHDVDTAEELTQETFYRAVYSIHKYNGSCKISVWLCQIAKHVWYQELRKRNRNAAQELTEDIPESSTPEQSALLTSDKLFLYKAIHTLSEPMREVVHMRLSGEFSFSEIGEVLGKSENWARTTFYRAKQKIMEVLSC